MAVRRVFPISFLIPDGFLGHQLEILYLLNRHLIAEIHLSELSC